jgi:hypothetical protein
VLGLVFLCRGRDCIATCFSMVRFLSWDIIGCLVHLAFDHEVVVMEYGMSNMCYSVEWKIRVSCLRAIDRTSFSMIQSSHLPLLALLCLSRLIFDSSLVLEVVRGMWLPVSVS